jgi:hypothetical protein
MDPLMVNFPVTESDFQMVFEGVDAIENLVMERLFAQIIPEVEPAPSSPSRFGHSEVVKPPRRGISACRRR